jgi:hypothetical protein
MSAGRTIFHFPFEIFHLSSAEALLLVRVMANLRVAGILKRDPVHLDGK